MDAGLAKILNSTVGTSGVKALDKVLDGVIEDVLTRNKSLVANAQVYHPFPVGLQTWYGNVGTTEQSLVTFTVPLDGSAYLRYRFGPAQSNQTATLLIYVNGVLHTSVARSTAYVGSEEPVVELFSFSRGDVVDIRVKNSVANNRIFVNLFAVCAIVAEGSALGNVNIKI